MQGGIFSKKFPSSRTAKLRNSILNFNQRENESLYEACERLKGYMRVFPHHEFSKELTLSNFYWGILTLNTNKVEENGSPKDEVFPYKPKVPFPSAVYTKAQKRCFQNSRRISKTLE